MNAAQRQFLLIGSLLMLLLAPYFTPLSDWAAQRIDDVKNRADSLDQARIRLFCPRSTVRRPFIITAYVKSPYREQTITLDLPPGLCLLAGETFEKRVPPPGEHGYSAVSWKVRALGEGDFDVQAVAPGVGATIERIRVWSGICTWGM